MPGRPQPYAVQAAIAALHARAPSFAETDWAQIVVLYDLLLARSEDPVRLARLTSSPFTDRLVRKFGLSVEGWRGAARAQQAEEGRV